MMDFLRKHTKTIFLITITAFLAGAFIGFGSYFFGKKTAGDAVAEINGKKIPYRHYTALLNRVLDNRRRSKQDVTPEITAQLKQEVMQDLIQEEVFWQEAQKYGITVSDQELAMDLQQYPAFQREGRFDRQAYFQVLYQVLRSTPREFEESRRRQIAVYKLRQLIASSVKISNRELELEYLRVNGSMNNFEQKRTETLEQLRQEKTGLVFNEWYKQINQSLKVKVYLDEIEGTAAAG